MAYYIAATKDEGCGHRHRSPQAARACWEKFRAFYAARGMRRPTLAIYRMTPGKRGQRVGP